MEHVGLSARRRRWRWSAGFALLVAVAAGGWLVGQQVQSPAQAASQAAPPTPSWITATVERRVLTQTVITRGDVRPQVSVVVGEPSSVVGSSVVTAIAALRGSEVNEGTRMLEVSGRPVFVLQGDVPVYRSLKPNMTGKDVDQLQAALTRLGCDTTVDGGIYGPVTKACVTKFYADAGYAPVPTSPTEAAEVAAAQRALTEAQAAVDAAQLSLDEASEGPSSVEHLAADLALRSALRSYNDAVAARAASVAEAKSALQKAQSALDRLLLMPDAAASEIADAEAEVASAWSAVAISQSTGDSAVASADDTVTLARATSAELEQSPDVTAEYIALGQALDARHLAQAALDEVQSSMGPTIAQGEIVFVPNLPARGQRNVSSLGPVDAVSEPSEGGGSTSGNALAVLAAGDLVVETTLSSTDRELIRAGMAIELLDEQTDARYPADIGTIAETPIADTGGQLKYSAVLIPTKALPDSLSGVNLRVTITAASTTSATLVVPIAAVSSAVDGSTNVSIVPAGADVNTAPVVVPIRTGLSADGFVSVEPVALGALDAGDLVVVGR